MRTLIVSAAAVAALGLLGGCHWMRGGTCDPAHPYQSARAIPPLKAPDGLPPPTVHNALKVPEQAAPARPRPAKGACLDEPPRFYADKPAVPAK